jgi:hypothetical protein
MDTGGVGVSTIQSAAMSAVQGGGTQGAIAMKVLKDTLDQAREMVRPMIDASLSASNIVYNTHGRVVPPATAGAGVDLSA